MRWALQSGKSSNQSALLIDPGKNNYVAAVMSMRLFLIHGQSVNSFSCILKEHKRFIIILIHFRLMQYCFRRCTNL